MKKTIILMLTAVMAFSASAYAAADMRAMTVLADQKPGKKAKKAKAEVKEVVFNVHLHCNNCVKKTEENIAFEKGVKGLDVSLENQTVAIKYDPSKTSEEVLKAAIEKLGYAVHGKVEPGHAHDHGHDHGHSHNHQH